MTITSLNGLIAAQKTMVSWMKTGTRTTVAVTPFTTAGVAGNPTGTLNVGNTTTGVIITDDGTEAPALPTFSNTGYISRIMWGSSVACTIGLYDRIWAAGAFAFNANQAITAPDFSSRIPSSSTALELWHEAVTAFTGVPTVQVLYKDQDNNSGDTGAVGGSSGAILGRMFRIPLAAGDNGVYGTSGITNIQGSVASGGTFNVSLMRPLWFGRVPVAGFYGVDDFIKTGMPVIYSTTALWIVLFTDSTAVGLPYVNIQVADG